MIMFPPPDPVDEYYVSFLTFVRPICIRRVGAYFLLLAPHLLAKERTHAPLAIRRVYSGHAPRILTGHLFSVRSLALLSRLCPPLSQLICGDGIIARYIQKTVRVLSLVVQFMVLTLAAPLEHR